MAKLRDAAEEHDFAIVGTFGSPKMKPNEKYASPRERLFGSGAWGRKLETLVDVQVDEDEKTRRIQTCRRNG